MGKHFVIAMQDFEFAILVFKTHAAYFSSVQQMMYSELCPSNEINHVTKKGVGLEVSALSEISCDLQI